MNKHNLVNCIIIAVPLVVAMTTFLLSGQPLESSPALAGTFLIGAVVSAMAAAFVSLELKWK